MTNENILDAIGGINEKVVQDAKAYKRPKSKRWFRWGAVAAVSYTHLTLPTKVCV